MIFPMLEFEPILQVEDMTRLDASKTFATPDEAAITLIEIQPSSSDDFYDVTTNKYLDWLYLLDGDQIVTVRVTTNAAPVTKSFTIKTILEVDDKLFSTDLMLQEKEPEIMNYLRDGRSSYKDKHRAAQKLIMSYLNDIKGFTDSNGDRLTVAAVVDIEEVKEWSRYMVLRMIFQGLSNAVDDVFDKKSKTYEKYESLYQNKPIYQFDIDGDLVKDQVRLSSIRMKLV